MRLQNKVRILLIGISILLPDFAQALVIEPIKIDSSRGDPLYAEIPFRYAASKNPIKVSIAQPFELGQAEVLDHRLSSHFNFYVRQNNQGDGVIVITSSRPITNTNIDLLLKIDDAGQIRMQQIRSKLPNRIERLENTLKETQLQPKLVANEKDIKLNLPETTALPLPTNKHQNIEHALQLNHNLPPILDASNSRNNTALAMPTRSVNTAVINQSDINQVSDNNIIQTENPNASSTLKPIAQTAPVIAVSSPAPTMQKEAVSSQQAAKNTGTASATSPQQNMTAPTTAKTIVTTTVVNNQATKKVQTETNKQTVANTLANEKNTSPQTKVQTAPIAKPSINKTKPKTTTAQASKPTASAEPTKAQISQQKASHKVQARETLWGIANQIAEQQNLPIHLVMQQIQSNNKHAFINGNANRLKQGVVLNLPSRYQPLTSQAKPIHDVTENTHAVKPAPTPSAQKQTQAHMSIVANSPTGKAQGTQAKGSNSQQQNELTTRLQKQRTATLSLQNNVRDLDQKLRSKERRLALLNARLAELEQQLKQRQNKPKSEPASNTTSRSQPISTVSITLIAYTDRPSHFIIATLPQEFV